MEEAPLFETTVHGKEAIEIKYGNRRSVPLSNLGTNPTWKMSVDDSPKFNNAEALYQWIKAAFFQAQLSNPRFANAYLRETSVPRDVLTRRFTEKISGMKAKSHGGKLKFAEAVAKALGNKAQAKRLYDEILVEWFKVSFEAMRQTLRMKFDPQTNPSACAALLSTGDKPLFEGRRRGGSVWEIARDDEFERLSDGDPHKWGLFGTLLMERRAALRAAACSPKRAREKEGGGAGAVSPPSVKRVRWAPPELLAK